jgi:uncharacterized protein
MTDEDKSDCNSISNNAFVHVFLYDVEPLTTIPIEDFGSEKAFIRRFCFRCTNINNIKFKFLTSISQVEHAAWNCLFGGDYPFIQHEFLSALEISGSVDESNGWLPNHLVAYDGERLVGAIPLYQKTHSYGEYVFDFEWANAYHHNGIHYYPKLVSAIPFTPCSGPRVAISPELQGELFEPMIEQVIQFCEKRGFSSWHTLFPDTQFRDMLKNCTPNKQVPRFELGEQSVDLVSSERFDPQTLLMRMGVQYHWYNKGYQNFDDFLNCCRQKKRKNIRQERKRIQQANVSLEWVEGKNATGQLWMQFFKFYQRTYQKRSGNNGYLNWAFFEYIANAMPEQLVFVVAKFEQQVIGMSLFFKGKDTLYGRYWGASADYEFLHFEACYYQGIEYCIENKLQHFDAGAQGEHKIPRGFEPIKTCSYHWIAHPQFRQAIDEFVKQESVFLSRSIDELRCRLPYKKIKP